MAISAENLTKRAIAGDRLAQGQLWERERPWLAAIAWSRTLDHDLTADLLQDLALLVVSKLHSLREPRALRTWLRRALGNRINDALRLRLGSVEPVTGLDLDARASAAPSADGQCSEMVAQLPVDLREALVLRAIEGLSVAEVAEILELNITTVETRLVRGRKLLRERLERCRNHEDGADRKAR